MKPAYGSDVGGGGAGVAVFAGVGVRGAAGRRVDVRVGTTGNAVGGGTSVGGSVGGADVKVGRGAVRVGVRVEVGPACATTSATRQPRRISQTILPRAMSVNGEGNLFNLAPEG